MTAAACGIFHRAEKTVPQKQNSDIDPEASGMESSFTAFDEDRKRSVISYE